MSDYFGALMRSSGLAAAGAKRPHDAREAAPPALDETAAEPRVVTAGDPAPGAAATHAAAMATTDAQTASAPNPPPTAAAQPQASIQRAHAAAVASPSPMTAPVPAYVPSAAPLPATVDGALRDGRADGPRVLGFPDSGSPYAATTQTHAPPEARVSEGSSRVRAALQWIAADPHAVDSRHIPMQHAPHADPAQPPPRTGASLTDAPAALPSPLAARERDDAAPVRSHAIEAWLREPAMPSHASRGRREHDDAAGELVEVSIGAIHVRVDAPAAQTRLAPAAPTAAAPRAPNRPASRDAVARRLLRRI
jgi:hypothetical protein